MAQTAVFTDAPRSLSGIFLAPFRVIGNLMVAAAETGPIMKEVNKLNALTDADLAAKGLTREGEIRRIFGARYYI